MRGLRLRDGLVTAAKIDTLSLVAYEVGMFPWMVLRTVTCPELQPTLVILADDAGLDGRRLLHHVSSPLGVDPKGHQGEYVIPKAVKMKFIVVQPEPSRLGGGLSDARRQDA